MWGGRRVLQPGTRDAVRAPCGPLPPFCGFAGFTGCSLLCARALSPPRALLCQFAGVLALCESGAAAAGVAAFSSGAHAHSRPRCPRVPVLPASGPRGALGPVGRYPPPNPSPGASRSSETHAHLRKGLQYVHGRGGRRKEATTLPPPPLRGREGASERGWSALPLVPAPPPFPSPPPAPRESRGAAGGGGGGGGGSPRGRVRPAPRRRSRRRRRRRLSRLRNESLGEHGAGPAVAAAGIAEAGAALRAPPRLVSVS